MFSLTYWTFLHFRGLRSGFPPQVLQVPLEATALSELPLKSGETIIVQNVEPAEAQGVVLRRCVGALK